MSQNLNFTFNKVKLNSIKTKLFVYGLFKNQKVNKNLNAIFDNDLDKIMKLESFKADKNQNIYMYGSNMQRLQIVGLGDKKKFSSDNLRASFANIIRNANSKKIDSLTIDSSSFCLENDSMSQACAEGLILGSYMFNDYKSKSKNNTVKKIDFFGNCNKNSLKKGKMIGYGVNLARDLGNHPPNILTPTYLANEAKSLSKAKNMKAKIIDVNQFQKLGLGSFYGVAMGSAEPAKMILVEYSGGNKKDKPLALVGKGLTFDTGGISLKPPPRMDEMKFDMCGSATVLGVLKAVAELQPKTNIIFAIGATENMPSSKAQRPGDIVKAYNGKTIEVLNTDAEGRLVLADVLSYVNKNFTPDSIIDFATLTGAVLIALGDRASGIMGNDDTLIKKVKSSSDETGEKVWQLPLWDEYCKDIKSQIADIKNLGRGRLAGTISAGAFLKEFVGDTPWVHMDIAGTAWGPKEPSYMPKHGATGVAVRLIYNLIETRNK